MERNSQHIKKLKRTQNERNSSSTYTDSSSSDEGLTPRNKKLLLNLHLPGSSGRKAYSKGKGTAKNRFRASQKKSTRASVGMQDLEKFSKFLIKDLKFESKIMLAKFKKDLRNVAATNSTRNTTNNRGRHILNSSQAHSQITPHPEPQGQRMISSSTRNFVPPAGQQTQGSVHATNPGRESLLINAVNQPGYSFNLQQQSSYPNASVTGYGNPSPLHQNNIHTSGMVPGVGLTLNQRFGNTSHFPNQTMAGNSSGGVNTSNWNMNRGPIMFSGTSHPVPNSVATNPFRSNLNLGAFEAWHRMYGPHNGNFQ